MSKKALAQGSVFPPIRPGVLRLYSMRFCPFAHRARLVLLHKNIAYEEVNINLKEKPDWFLALNPLGQVPVLQIDDKVVVESTATCDWLDDVYPENRLQPADPYRRAWDRALLEYMGKINGPYYEAMRITDAAQVQKKIEEMWEHFKVYEDELAKRDSGPFFGGTQPAMIDFFFWPTYERFPALAMLKKLPAAKMDTEKFPKLAAWGRAMEELPAVQAVRFDPDQHTNFFKAYIGGEANFDLYLEE